MKNVSVKEMCLTLINFKDDNVYHVYCPALNLIGCGYTETEAQESFKIVFDEYINYTTENNTLIADLEHCGWKRNGNNKNLFPPKMSESLLLNNDFGDIVNNFDFDKRSINAKIPIA